jgi:hypothetical protein
MAQVDFRSTSKESDERIAVTIICPKVLRNPWKVGENQLIAVSRGSVEVQEKLVVVGNYLQIPHQDWQIGKAIKVQPVGRYVIKRIHTV